MTTFYLLKTLGAVDYPGGTEPHYSISQVILKGLRHTTAHLRISWRDYATLQHILGYTGGIEPRYSESQDILEGLSFTTAHLRISWRDYATL
jgi:hypothetical protein